MEITIEYIHDDILIFYNYHTIPHVYYQSDHHLDENVFYLYKNYSYLLLMSLIVHLDNYYDIQLYLVWPMKNDLNHHHQNSQK